jgi:hypothetical protein
MKKSIVSDTLLVERKYHIETTITSDGSIDVLMVMLIWIGLV